MIFCYGSLERSIVCTRGGSNKRCHDFLKSFLVCIQGVPINWKRWNISLEIGVIKNVFGAKGDIRWYVYNFAVGVAMGEISKYSKLSLMRLCTILFIS